VYLQVILPRYQYATKTFIQCTFDPIGIIMSRWTW